MGDAPRIFEAHPVDPLQLLIDGQDLSVCDLRLAQARHPSARVLQAQDQRPLHVTLRSSELLRRQIAFGHVARAVAERAKPFGLHIIAYDPYIEEIVMVERGVEPVSLSELLARADILSMHTPATESANRLIREEHFRQMKPTAIYVSTGRGPTTDEAALIKALDDGMIAGAGLDVLEQEPPGGNNPLLRMNNVILTAHVASATARFDPARRRRVGLELSLALSGKWPMSCVNPSVLAGSGLKRWQPVSMERGPNS